MERVLGSPDEVYTDVVDVDIRPWLEGSRASAVQVTVGDVLPKSNDSPRVDRRIRE